MFSSAPGRSTEEHLTSTVYRIISQIVFKQLCSCSNVIHTSLFSRPTGTLSVSSTSCSSSVMGWHHRRLIWISTQIPPWEHLHTHTPHSGSRLAQKVIHVDCVVVVGFLCVCSVHVVAVLWLLANQTRIDWAGYYDDIQIKPNKMKLRAAGNTPSMWAPPPTPRLAAGEV